VRQREQALRSGDLDDRADIDVTVRNDPSLDRGATRRRRCRHIGSGSQPVDVIYAPMDEDMLLSSTGHNGAPLRPGLLEALNAGNLTIVNALGNGVADDKAVYAFVPAMVEYYLGEKPSLPQVPTWICAERAQRDYVLDHLDELVVKPIDGLGGSGVLIGPEATDAALEAPRRELLIRPERFIAQELVALSTQRNPTCDHLTVGQVLQGVRHRTTWSPTAKTQTMVEVRNQSIIAAQELFSSVGLTGFEPATT
jgi:uncharacterized circularly permuted ATP-grasp superfamily protein